MALEKITEAQMNANGVVAAPDVLNGTAAENKAIFDRMVRSLVAPAYNACVDVVNELADMEAGVKESESQRNEAEQERAAAEESRLAAEEERQEAERIRQDLESGYVKQTEDNATAAKSWAVGETGSREGENTNNAKYWAEQAKNVAGGGTGDMQISTYDPQGKAQDVFQYAEDKAGEAVEAHNESQAAHTDIRELIANKKGAQVYEAVIGTEWTKNEDTGVKTQTVEIDGITADQTAKVDHSSASADGTYEGYVLFVEEENQYLTCITNGFAETVDGGIRFAIFKDANTVNIPIVVEVV